MLEPISNLLINYWRLTFLPDAQKYHHSHCNHTAMSFHCEIFESTAFLCEMVTPLRFEMRKTLFPPSPFKHTGLNLGGDVLQQRVGGRGNTPCSENYINTPPATTACVVNSYPMLMTHRSMRRCRCCRNVWGDHWRRFEPATIGFSTVGWRQVKKKTLDLFWIRNNL